MSGRAWAKASLLIAAVLGTSACATPGRWTDYTSVSVGQTHGGRIHRPVQMPTRRRGNQWGTDELVEVIERAAAAVWAQSSSRPGGRAEKSVTLGVADLSPKRGGKTIWHASHQSGRDVDLIFYSVDQRGRPLPPPEI